MICAIFLQRGIFGGEICERGRLTQKQWKRGSLPPKVGGLTGTRLCLHDSVWDFCIKLSKFLLVDLVKSFQKVTGCEINLRQLLS